MKILLVVMTGIGFTLGVVFGLLLHLPSDSLPAQRNNNDHFDPLVQDGRFKRQAAFSRGLEIKSYERDDPSSLSKLFEQTNGDVEEVQSLQISDWNDGELSARKTHTNSEHLKKPRVNKANSNEKGRARKSGQRMLSISKQTGRVKVDTRLSADFNMEENGDSANPDFSRGLKLEREAVQIDLKDTSVDSLSSSKSVRNSGVKRSNSTGRFENSEIEKKAKEVSSPSLEDELYLSSIVNGVYWTEKAENACRKPFDEADTESWRSTVQGLDVVKMETGCGRMQNRQLTFRDASKACARYRLNTDQIQGDIFSYYLAKLLNISNLPPTILASVNSVDKKWRTVHLDLSLAQWADSKLVVLTKFIEELKPAHIPKEFRDEHRQLFPNLAHLGTKSQTELCELMQWSDLIIFDYLTANLDRVINNMFNSQWNDQMMSSPTHNLEKYADGGLVFLDNESGLFHGFRLIDKYEKLHRALLDSVCVFRSSTADVIKRLATSGSVGKELRDLLDSNEPLAKLVPSMPAKNVKILEGRVQQVYEQIVKCGKDFNR